MSKERDINIGLAIMGIAIAVGLALAGSFIGNTLYKSKVGVNTATVKGLATRKVKSNKAEWHMRFVSKAETRQEAYRKAQNDQKIILEFLEEAGLKNEASRPLIKMEDHVIRADLLEYQERYSTATIHISIYSKDLQKVLNAYTELVSLTEKGISVSDNAPDFLFTNLNEIKPEMLEEATKNARIAAAQFAEDAGVKVGGIKNARQGGFVIRDEGKEYGDRKKINKEVRVVTTVTFYLKD